MLLDNFECPAIEHMPKYNMKSRIEENILEAANAIAAADALFISAGAGMGVDSGLPDFRGDEGFWNAYPLLREENLSFQDLANPSWFSKVPHRAWGFYGHRFKLYNSTTPHQGFSIIKKWLKSKNIEPFVFTSNVDGHFQHSLMVWFNSIFLENNGEFGVA